MKVIGVYRKCDFVTMSGTCFALSGILCALNGKTMYAVFCLICAAICDAFDGVVARKHKSLESQTVYGIELDSLSDAISFGVLPMIISLNLMNHNLITYIVCVLFCVCGIIRLAYFNMLATTKKSDGKEFIGLPITASAIIVPLVYFIVKLLKVESTSIIFLLTLIITGTLYIMPFKLKKLSEREKIVFSALGIISIIVCLLKIFG